MPSDCARDSAASSGLPAFGSPSKAAFPLPFVTNQIKFIGSKIRNLESRSKTWDSGGSTW